jgi:outer membrane protein OmpA-like peptidoglycan-associated protein
MLRHLLRYVLGAYLLYLALALLVLLPALNILAPRLSEKHLDRELRSELILFNPFTLAFEIRKARLAEPDGTPFAAAKLLRVDFGALRSLTRQGFVLDELAIDGLELALRRYDERTLNISDLLATDSTPAEEDAAPLPGLSVHVLTFNARELSFEDRTRTPTYRTFLSDIAFSVTGLSTVVEAGSPYELLLVTERNGTLRWRGELSLATGTSSGELQLADLDLRPFYRYIDEDYAFAMDSALLELAASYRASWGGKPTFELANGSVELQELALVPRDGITLPDTRVALQRLEINGIAADSESREASAAGIRVQGPVASGFLEQDLLSLQQLFTPLSDAGTAPQPAATATAGDDAPWRLRVKQVAVSDGSLTLDNPYTQPARLELHPVSLELRDLAYPAVGQTPFELALTVNNDSELSLAGSLQTDAGDGSLRYTLTALPLALANPALDSVVNADVLSGQLSLDGELRFADFAPTTASADLRLPDLSLMIHGSEDRALSWTELAIPGIAVDLDARRVETGIISLRGYRGRVQIREDGRLNVQLAMRESAADNGDEPAADEGAAPWTVALGGVEIAGGTVDFQDDSLPLEFRTLIGDIDGTIGALETAGTQRVPVDLAGSVDGYAPVSIRGAAAPFAPEPDLDLAVSFIGIDIARLSPYAGTYAGYAIKAGTLNLDLNYALAEGRLQGENRAIISQMQLGAPFESERAADLPLKLAIALLKDSRGVIDLDVPVEGDVDDPSFRLGKVIGRAIANVITNIVTAPFKLLAGLAGSDEDLQFVAFAPADATLTAPAAGKLDALGDALAQRPQLQLLASGATDSEDEATLREQRLREQLLAAGLSPAALAARDESWAAAIAERYIAIAPAAGAAGKDKEPPPPAAQYEAVLAALTVPRAVLSRLATDRAAAVKRYLVATSGIAADRVTISGGATTANAGEDSAAAGVTLDVGA